MGALGCRHRAAREPDDHKRILEAPEEKRTVHSVTLMDNCHLKKMRSWNRSVKSTIGRVVFRGDIVKDDSGSCAVFTEPQMTTVNVVDVIERQQDSAGQAADAVSAYTKVKMKDALKLLKIP